MTTWHQLVKDIILLHEAKLYCKGQMDVTVSWSDLVKGLLYIWLEKRLIKIFFKKIDWTRDRMLAITNQEIVIDRAFISHKLIEK